MKQFEIKEALFLQAQRVPVEKLNASSQLTAVDIYVGDQYLRIATRVDIVDQIMEAVVKLINIPGETVMCHEVFNLDDRFVDYTKWPLVKCQWQLEYVLKRDLGLVRIYECVCGSNYIKSTEFDLISDFAGIYGCGITKYLTRI